MAKINIPFNGTDYSINESALVSAKDSLKTHLSTVMNGSGGGLEPITFDGVVGDRVTTAGYGQTTYVKVSDAILSADDLLGAIVSLSNGNDILLISDYIMQATGGVAIAEAMMVSVAEVEAFSESISLNFSETGTYFAYPADASLYITSITFAGGSTGGDTTITLDGTDYSVDSTKLSTATDGFVAHIGTLTGGEGGGLEPIVWDGTYDGGFMFEFEPDCGFGLIKVSDTVPSLNDLAEATFTMSTGDTLSPNGDTSQFEEAPGFIVMQGDAMWVVSDPSFAAEQGFDGTGTYMFYAPEMTGYIQSITFAGGGTAGGDTKLTINGAEYLVDSTKLSDAIADLHEALGRLSE